MGTRNVVWLWLVISALVGFFVAAPNFYFNLIGLDASGFVCDRLSIADFSRRSGSFWTPTTCAAIRST